MRPVAPVGAILATEIKPTGEDFGGLKHPLLEKFEDPHGHIPPRRPRGPRFGLIRRIVRFLRRDGSGDG